MEKIVFFGDSHVRFLKESTKDNPHGLLGINPDKARDMYNQFSESYYTNSEMIHFNNSDIYFCYKTRMPIARLTKTYLEETLLDLGLDNHNNLKLVFMYGGVDLSIRLKSFLHIEETIQKYFKKVAEFSRSKGAKAYIVTPPAHIKGCDKQMIEYFNNFLFYCQEESYQDLEVINLFSIIGAEFEQEEWDPFFHMTNSDSLKSLFYITDSLYKNG
jgi:hypothetical protein